jgi:flagellin
MDEQIKILDTIKVKATQAAQDGQTTETRKALQQDITRLMEELDNIAQTTSYNGKKLLSGSFVNQKFQIGAYSNEIVTASIGPTSSDKIGDTRFETSRKFISAATTVTLTFKAVDGLHDVKLESVKISTSAGTGIGALAEVINKNSEKLGVRATWQVVTTGQNVVASGDITGLKINGVTIGDITGIKANDADAKLVAAINNVKDQTGVEAYIDERGHLNLRSLDGRGIVISAQSGLLSIAGIASGMVQNFGRLTLIRNDAKDIIISGGAPIGFSGGEAQATINLRSIKGSFKLEMASAMGFFANSLTADYSQAVAGSGTLGGVLTIKGAMAVMDIADSAMKMLDKIRADIGSVQNQLVSTINNISVTQVNVKAAESQIRDVDFAAETAKFQKYNLLAQSGSYALSQANAVQQNVLKLLQ